MSNLISFSSNMSIAFACHYSNIQNHSRMGSRINAQISSSMSVESCIWSSYLQTKISHVDLIFHPNRNPTGIRCGLVCEDDGNGRLVRGGRKDSDSCSSEKMVPRLPIDTNSNKETGRLLNGNERVQFLEERDEEVLSRRMLVLSRSNKVRSALRLCHSMELLGLRPEAHACNSLLSCLLRVQMYAKATSVFEFMKTNDITTGHSYSLMLKVVSDSKGFYSALDMFAEWERDPGGKCFDVIVYNTVISLCGGVNDWVETERFWRKMKEKGWIGSGVTYALLVSIFVRCGQNELAIEAYNETVENGVEAQDDTMQAVIRAFTNDGKWVAALKIFIDMLKRGLKPDRVVCNALINSLGKCGEVKLALEIYKIMKCLGHRPDSFTWDALLGALHGAKQYTEALCLFESIRERNSHVYNRALMSCQKLGYWDKAVQFVWQMEELEMEASTVSYNLVIGACETARKPEIGLRVYDHMVDRNCAPDTFTYLSLLRSCIWGSLWWEVEKILHMVALNAYLYNAAIHGMCLRGRTESAKKLYMKMQKSGLRPDGKTQALMLQM